MAVPLLDQAAVGVILCSIIKRMPSSTKTITAAALRRLMKTHAVTGGRTKKEMAEALMRVRGGALPSAALEAILPLLHGPAATEARRLLRGRAATPVTNYRGMWRKRPKALSAMKRNELITHLRAFRRAWERITRRNQDLSNERLRRETVPSLRSLLKYYYSGKSVVCRRRNGCAREAK